MPKRKYNKDHQDWALKVKEKFNNKCLICGKEGTLAAHHLIPWEFEKYRFDVNNGIPLCGKHHMRFGYGLSPHSHGSVLFSLFLLKNYPNILKWIEDNYDYVTR